MRIFALLFAILIGLPFAYGQTEFQVPRLSGPVMDEVGYLTRSDERELTQLLYDFNRRGVAQVQVLIVPSLQGIPIEQASIQIADQWKLGDEKKDNGVLFLISAQDRAMRIEVGQGLEGAIPDVYAKRIISDQVIPLFRAKKFSAGIVMGVHQIITLADKEFADTNQLEKSSEGGNLPIGLVIVLLIIIIVLGRFGGGGRGNFRGRGYGVLGGLGGLGGGGFGGGGGGGWSGGGGGFSGGGASGGW